MTPDKDPLVYGVDGSGDNLVLLPEKVAQELARDYKRISGVHTLGQARRVARELERLSLPDIEDDNDGEIDSETYNPWGFEDYPPRAATVALDELPEELADIGEEMDFMGFTPWLKIDPATERVLVETAEVRGFSIRRDDDLIRAIDPSF